MTTYPDIPGHQATDTSKEAAELVSSVEERYALILGILDKRGPMTSDYVAAHIGRDILAVRPRMTELKLKGLIYDTGYRSPNRSGRRAIVYAIIPKTESP